jgi:hypothetical protein
MLRYRRARRDDPRQRLDSRLLYAIGSRDAPGLIQALQTVLPSDEDRTRVRCLRHD